MNERQQRKVMGQIRRMNKCLRTAHQKHLAKYLDNDPKAFNPMRVTSLRDILTRVSLVKTKKLYDYEEFYEQLLSVEYKCLKRFSFQDYVHFLNVYIEIWAPLNSTMMTVRYWLPDLIISFPKMTLVR